MKRSLDDDLEDLSSAIIELARIVDSNQACLDMASGEDATILVPTLDLVRVDIARLHAVLGHVLVALGKLKDSVEPGDRMSQGKLKVISTCIKVVASKGHRLVVRWKELKEEHDRSVN